MVSLNPSGAGARLSTMTRAEVVDTIHHVLRQTHVPLTLMHIRALPFAWELRFEDADGIDRYVTVHQGSASSISEAITSALTPEHRYFC